MSDDNARIAELEVAADPAAWEACGFAVAEGVARIGTIAVRLTGPDGGPAEVRSWALRNADGGAFDGLAHHEPRAAAGDEPREHPNGVARIDHLVVFTPELERTITAFEAAGVRCRRVREVGEPPEQLRQAFFRFGEAIVEVVQVPAAQAGPGGVARFWGITFTVTDIDTASSLLGERLGSVRDAVQPGRRIATVRAEAGLGIPVALITPEAARR